MGCSCEEAVDVRVAESQVSRFCGSMGDGVVSTGEQRGKQNYDSACGASQSPEKEAKGDAKKPANPSGPRPRSYPMTSTAGSSVKDDVISAKPRRPRSYPGARSKRSHLGPTMAPPDVPSPRLTDTAVNGPVTEFSSIQRDYPHDIVYGAEFVELHPCSASVSVNSLNKI